MTEPRDVHAPYVDDLAREKDWAGLVRYWMAHQYEPALDAAILTIRDRDSTSTKFYAVLTDYLTEVRHNPLPYQQQQSLAGLDKLGSPVEKATVKLLNLHPLRAYRSTRLPLTRVIDLNLKRFRRLHSWGLHPLT